MQTSLRRTKGETFPKLCIAYFRTFLDDHHMNTDEMSSVHGPKSPPTCATRFQIFAAVSTSGHPNCHRPSLLRRQEVHWSVTNMEPF